MRQAGLTLTQLPALHVALHYFCWWLAAKDMHAGQYINAAILILGSGGMLAFKMYLITTDKPPESHLFMGRHRGWMIHDIVGVALVGAAINALNSNGIARVPAVIPLPGGHMPTELGVAVLYGACLAAVMHWRGNRKKQA